MGTRITGRTFKGYLLKGLSVLFLSGLFIVVLDSDLRSNVRSMISPSYRVILAVAAADLDNSGKNFEILKVKTNEGLFLEVYGRGKGRMSNSQMLMASTKLPDKKDGYFTFNGEVTNLAIDDIDNDHKKEILATTFDNDLVAHLNVYRYVPGQKELEMVHLH